MDASLERSTQATGSSAVKAWDRFCKSIGANMFCLNGCEPYSTMETIYLIMTFASFEAFRGKADQGYVYRVFASYQELLSKE